MRVRIATVLLTAVATAWSCQKSGLESPAAGDGVLRFSASVETALVRSSGPVAGWSRVDVDISGVRLPVIADAPTRSAGVTEALIPDGSILGVCATLVPGGGWNSQTLRPEYIYNLPVTRQGLNYTYPGMIYWPDQPLRFFAYYPYAETAGSSGITLSLVTQPGFPTIDFVTAAEVRDQVDLLACATPVMNSVTQVRLSLRHALTRVGFSVRSSNIPEPIQVTRIELHNVVNRGVQSFNESNGITWSGLDYDLNTSNYIASVANGALKADLPLTDEYQDVMTPEGYMHLIPQEIKAGRTLVVLRYIVNGYPKELKALLPAALPNSAGGWTPGKSINYKITLSPEENEFVIIPAEVGSANSFIINSYSRTGDPTVDFLDFSLPVTRVNEYYGNPAYARFYGTQTGLAPDTKWGVEVIWMDMANLIDLTKATGVGDDPGDDPARSAAFRYREAPDPDTYNDQGRFRVRVRVNAEGNALLGIFKDPNGNGVRDAGEEYIWSWHLWVTRYNPNVPTGGVSFPLSASEGGGAWPVIGGAVHRYVDIDQPAPEQYNNATFGSQTLWAPSAGLYAGLVVMDRNLGAFSDGFPELQNGNADRPLGALYFQYGRKDPFLSNAYRYTADGTPENNHYLQDINLTRYSVQELVATPWIFPYAPRGNRGAWAKDLPTNEPCSWFDPAAVYSTVSPTDNTLTALPPKSIFDPSPYGWRLPANGTWSGMTLTNSPWVSGLGRVFTFGTTSVNFPAYGFRVASTGQFVAIGLQGCLWTNSTSSSTPPLEETGRSFFFFRGGNTNVLFQPSAVGFTTDATSVRPIQDPVNPYPRNNFP